MAAGVTQASGVTAVAGGVGGGVTSIIFGSGLTGGTVTTTGTVTIDQTFANIWTANQEISDAEPRFLFNQTGAGADLKLWDIDVAAGVFSLRTRTDADGAGSSILTVTRGTTTNIASIAFGTATGSPVYTFPSTGATTFSGGVTITSNNGLTSSTVKVTSTTIATNGLYLPAANTLGFATNTLARGSFDANGNFIHLFAKADQSKSVQVPITGFTITIGNNTSTLILNPAGTLATGTITMPATPIDGQEVQITSSQTITALTVSPNAAQTISNAPTTLTAGIGYKFIYHVAGTNWFRLY